MFRAFMIVISILSALPAGFAYGDSGDSIQITIENASSFPVLLQVRDEVCISSVSDECIQADFIVKSIECRKKPLMDACVQAQQKLDGGSCVNGLVYEGNMAAGGKISLSICANSSGYGRVSMRDFSRNTIWKSNFMVNNGDSLRYP